MTAVELTGLPRMGPSVVVLGVFDGVHLGHRHLASATRRAALERGASSVALVFSPHPDEVVRGRTVVPRLLPPAVTLERLRRAGIDRAVEVRFDEALRRMTPEEFLAALGRSTELRALVMTPESAFGRGRTGTVERVARIGEQRGFDVVRVDSLLVDGRRVSASGIRGLLAEGAIGDAARLLGGPPLLRGTVIHGDRRGRELGFPTANLQFDYAPVLPPLGIYLGRARVPERGVGPAHPALVSVGVRPTFHDDGRVLVEVYLLDWDGDLYGTSLDVELMERLRGERRFPSADALVAQMREDEAMARERIGR